MKSGNKSSNGGDGVVFVFLVAVNEERDVGNLRSIQLDFIHQKNIFNQQFAPFPFFPEIY